MVWALILEPYKRYSQTVEKTFHLTNAALDVTTGDGEINQVMLGYEGKDYLVCTLQKGKTVQTPLQLFFRKGDDISFTMSGKGNVHLTGFVEPEDYFESDEGEDDSEEEEEEIPELMPIGKDKKRKAESSPEKTNSKKAKNESKKKQAVENGADSDSDDDGSDLDIKKLLEDDETDENDESYIPNETNEISLADSDDDDDDDEDDDDEDDEDDDDDDEDEDDSEDNSKVVESPPKEKKQKQKEMEKAKQNGAVDKKNKGNKENDSQQKEKKVLPGNVAIEDLKVGQGPVAKQGKMVQVYYEGRLKSNNKMFDSCLKGPGFKFRLGKKEVITGWDVGLVGMKVGGKRRIVCPPGMAYGKKGSPPVIPPNSTLVFEVELKNVN